MTPRRASPSAPCRAGGRQRLVVLRDECCDHDDPGCFGPSDDAGRRPRPGRVESDGRTAQPGIDCVMAGWNDLGPEPA